MSSRTRSYCVTETYRGVLVQIRPDGSTFERRFGPYSTVAAAKRQTAGWSNTTERYVERAIGWERVE